MHLRVVAATVFLFISFVRPAFSAPDTLYRAGQLLGRWLYWLPQTGLPLDTIGWHAAQQTALGETADTAKSMTQAIAGIRAGGRQIMQLTKCTAMAAGLTQAIGYPVILLTQWHATLAQNVMVPKPGLEQRAMRHNVVSDFYWESLERVDKQGRTVSGDDFRLSLYYAGAGYSMYDGKDLLTRVDQQILGIQGFSVYLREADYKEDMNMRRIVFGVYAIVPAGKKTSDLQQEIEKEMDKAKLDISYKSPVIKEIR